MATSDQSSFSNQHFAPCSPQISMTNRHFRISILHQQISVSPLPYRFTWQFPKKKIEYFSIVLINKHETVVK